MNNSLEKIDASIEELDAILPKLESAAAHHHGNSDQGWWLTMAGDPAGAALAVIAGNEAHQLDKMISIVENKLVLLHSAKITLLNRSHPD